MSGAKRRGEQPVMDRRPSPHRENWARDKAREEGIHHRLLGRDGSPAEPPPGELGRAGFITGCWAGMDRRPSPHRENWAAWVSSPAVGPGWIAGRAPTGRTGPRGFHHRLLGRDGSPAEPPPGELGRVGFITGCWAGMDRRPSPHRENWAARVSSPAVWPGWIAGRAPTGRTGPRGFHHRLLAVEWPPPGGANRRSRRLRSRICGAFPRHSRIRHSRTGSGVTGGGVIRSRSGNSSA